MTGPKPLPKRFLHIVRSRASSFNLQYPLLSLRSSSSFLCLLPRLLVTSICPFIFPSITCNVMVLDTFSSRLMTTLSRETDTIVMDIGSTSEFVIGCAVAPPTCGNVTIVRIIHQLISRSPSPPTHTIYECIRQSNIYMLQSG